MAGLKTVLVNHYKEHAMSLIEGIIGPIAKLIDKIIPDPKARDAAKLELIKLQGSQEMDALRTQLSAVLAEAQSADPWTSRARPSFLYVMYAMLLWAIPMGLIAAIQPEAAANIARHERLSERPARAFIRLVWHWLSRLHCCPPMGHFTWAGKIVA
jgi:hypothetical protein